MNTLVSAILSALQDTRDAGYTIEERAEAIAAAVRAETPESGALSQWIASLRVGDTLTVDDIHRFVRVELALRNADKHHQQARLHMVVRNELDTLRASLAACERVVEAAFYEGQATKYINYSGALCTEYTWEHSNARRLLLVSPTALDVPRDE